MSYTSLIPGITVMVPPGETLSERIRISSGVQPAVGPEYGAGAFIPRPPWRIPTDAEAGVLAHDDESFSVGTTVAVVRLDFDFETHFSEFRVLASGKKKLEDIHVEARSPRHRQVMNLLGAYLRDHFQGASGDKETSQEIIWAKPANHVVTTTDPQAAGFIGLHVDNWTRASFSERLAVENRICANIGSEDRFLLFMNLPIGEIYRAIKLAPQPALAPLPMRNYIVNSTMENAHRMLGGSKVGRAFMALYPSYPVLSLRVKPGEAYIAPTENMIHDGSSEGSNAADVTLTVRGRFVGPVRSQQMPIGA